jgi:hypothetical protein
VVLSFQGIQQVCEVGFAFAFRKSRLWPNSRDLIAISFYLQRDLFEPAKRGLAPGGVILAIVHIAEPGEELTYKRLKSGELEHYFQGWEILHRYEGKPTDKAHHRSVAEIVARRP